MTYHIIESISDLAQEDVFFVDDISDLIDYLTSLSTDEENYEETERDEFLQQLYALDELKNSGVEEYIKDSYFKEYAMELAEDVSNIKFDQWPAAHIDWDEAIEALKMDYMEISVNGKEFWAR